MNPWLLRRPEYGHYENLLQELYREDHSSYKNFLRVPPELFMELIERVGPRLNIARMTVLWKSCSVV